MSKQNNLDRMAGIVVPICDELSFPPELCLAQWAIESDWGMKPSARNNVFGMTKATRHMFFHWVPTREVLSEASINALSPLEKEQITSRILRPDGMFDVRLSRRFAAYNSIAESVLDYVELLMLGDRYAEAWSAYKANRDLPAFIKSIAPRYASDPGYAPLVLAIARQANIAEAIRKKRLGSSVS